MTTSSSSASSTPFTHSKIDNPLSTRTLSISDLPAATKVEHAAFPPVEAFSHEAGVYRLTRFPELCLGLFVQNEADRTDAEGAQLIGHVIATRETAPHITTEMMDVPEDWPSRTSDAADAASQSTPASDGGSIAVHSLAIDPQHQGKGLGPLLMKRYVEYLREKVSYAERVVILAHGPLVGFYERVGFENEGRSECQFAEGGWFDMVSQSLFVRV